MKNLIFGNGNFPNEILNQEKHLKYAFWGRDRMWIYLIK